MARIEHLALWTGDIDRLAEFYRGYFGAEVGDEYRNPVRGFASRFLRFADGARLELMTTAATAVAGERRPPSLGLAHFAIAVGSERAVDALTARLREDRHEVLSGPRRTGDGYYESVVQDPDGNHVEITA